MEKKFQFLISFSTILLSILINYAVTANDNKNTNIKPIVKSEMYNKTYFHISDEILLSTEGMDCNYDYEDYKNFYIHFEYPKIILTENDAPLIAFVDMKSEKIIFAEVQDGTSEIINKIDPLAPETPIPFKQKWPIVFKNDKNINLVFFSRAENEEDYYLHFYELVGNKGTPVLKLKKLFSPKTIKLKGFNLKGIYTVDESTFLLAGDYCEYFFHLGILWGGNLPTFYKNVTVTLTGEEFNRPQYIEKKGRFGVDGRTLYTVTDKDTIHCAWIREYENRKDNNMVCYSINSLTNGWIDPIILYKQKEIKRGKKVKNLSLAADRKKAFLLWEDQESSLYYYAEVDDGRIITSSVIENSAATILSTTEDTREISESPSSRLKVDNKGNVYALWVRNSNKYEHEMILKFKSSDKWSENIIVSSGNGLVRLPDMELDNKGNIHLTYLRKNKGGTWMCCYRKIENGCGSPK